MGFGATRLGQGLPLDMKRPRGCEVKMVSGGGKGVRRSLRSLPSPRRLRRLARFAANGSRRLHRSAPPSGFEPPVLSPDMKRPRGCEVKMVSGGGKGVRTPGLRLAKPALSQLSYTPFRNKHPSGDSALAGVFIAKELVDLTRFELVTSRLSAGRSNQLSYRSIAPGDNTPPARLRQP